MECHNSHKHSQSLLTTVIYVYVGTELPGMQYSHRLTASIKAKCTADDVLDILKDIPNPLADEDMDVEQSHNPLAIDVFVQTLLNLGSKSFSHSFAAIAK